jgi:hypothetical protein
MQPRSTWRWRSFSSTTPPTRSLDVPAVCHALFNGVYVEGRGRSDRGRFVALAATRPVVQILPVGGLTLPLAAGFMSEIRAAGHLPSNIVATLVARSVDGRHRSCPGEADTKAVVPWRPTQSPRAPSQNSRNERVLPERPDHRSACSPLFSITARAPAIGP